MVAIAIILNFYDKQTFSKESVKICRFFFISVTKKCAFARHKCANILDSLNIIVCKQKQQILQRITNYFVNKIFIIQITISEIIIK